MVRREIRVHWLACNLIRKTIAQAAVVRDKLPRQLSFAAGLARRGRRLGPRHDRRRPPARRLGRRAVPPDRFASASKSPQPRGTAGGHTPPQASPAAQATPRRSPRPTPRGRGRAANAPPGSTNTRVRSDRREPRSPLPSLPPPRRLRPLEAPLPQATARPRPQVAAADTRLRVVRRPGRPSVP